MADLVVSAATAMSYGQNDIDVTSSELDLQAAVPSAHAYKVKTVSVANISTSTTETVTVRRYIGGTGKILWKGPLAAGGTIVVVSERATKLQNEGDKITVQGTSASGVFTASADWEDYS